MICFYFLDLDALFIAIKYKLKRKVTTYLYTENANNNKMINIFWVSFIYSFYYFHPKCFYGPFDAINACLEVINFGIEPFQHLEDF